MSDDFAKLDPEMKLPLDRLSSKPVHLMTDEELSLYRKEISLLRVPQTEITDTNSDGQTAVPKVTHSFQRSIQQMPLKGTDDEMEPYSFLLFYFFVLPVIVGLIFTLPILLLIHLLSK